LATVLAVGFISTSPAEADTEPNNSQAAAEPIAVGLATSIVGKIAPAGDQDFYRFSGVAGKTYVAEVLNVASAVGSMSLYGYNSSSTVLASTPSCNGSGNVCARIQFTTSLAGTYFLRARATSTTTSGSYTIRVLLKP
jgi:hypothetical protein